MAEEYMKGRDYISAAKLNYFHYFLRQLIGYNLHSHIQLDRSKAFRIADLNTKTAIWSIDIAESLPQIQIDAFDRDDTLFPTAERLPENVKLHLHDIYQPFPSDLIGQFDLVNIRLMVALTLDQVEKLVVNATTLLKPGGYIQWIEHDKTELHVTKPDPNVDSTATEALTKLQQNGFPNYNSSWTRSIAPIFESHHLTVIADDRVAMRKSMQTQFHEILLLGFLDAPCGLSEAIDKFREQHLEGYKREFKTGVSVLDSFTVAVGQKELQTK